MLKEGDFVPDLTVQTQQGTHKLSDFKGRFVVLYFYPKDNTPGCTQEAEDFRDMHQAFVDAGCAVLGCSRDSLSSHEKFAEKLGLPFALIADTEEALCQQFDVLKEKNMYGKKVIGIERSTFLIDPEGRLVQSWLKIKVPNHVEQVLAALQEKQA